MSTKVLTVKAPFHYRVPMTGYTKLFGSIIASTIWRESKETKIVWITMLAMANKDGIVEASVPGLADFSRVTAQECREALLTLQAPDPDSRTKDFEGRRIRPVDGGWQILNHAKYRQKMRSIERREYMTQKQQERRARMSTTVNHRQPIAEAEAKAEAGERSSLSASERISLEKEGERIRKELDKLGVENLLLDEKIRRKSLRERLAKIEAATRIELP